MSEQPLLIERRGPVATVTFNRPERHNALSLEILSQVRSFFGQVGTDHELRVIVLRGDGGRAFSSGSDHADLTRVHESGTLISGPDDPFEQALGSILECPVPVIAMIQGFAIGGGCTLAAACDIRIAGASARLGIPAAKIGLLYSQKGLQPVLDLLGPGGTKLVFFSGRLFSAEQALHMGLVDQVVPDDEVHGYTYALAEEIVANAPLTVRNTKRILRLMARREIGSAEQAEIDKLVEQTQASADFEEGQRAYREKRAPRFEAR